MRVFVIYADWTFLQFTSISGERRGDIYCTHNFLITFSAIGQCSVLGNRQVAQCTSAN